MSKAELIDDHVSAQQCKRAVTALLDHALKHQQKREESELLPGKEQHVWLQVAVKQMQPEKKIKPFKIPIKYPLVDPRTTPVCLITKDPQREYKNLLEANGIKFISRVVGIEKLKGKFKPFEARRLLLKENGLFLADERVVPLLPKLLGKAFFAAKKQPIPVCLTRKDLKGELERAISSTYMHQNKGTCVSIKVGVISQTAPQVLANLKTALPSIVKAIKGEWDNVQSLSIKTNSSVALPIWSCDLGVEEGARWDGLVADDGSESDDEESDSDEGKVEDMEIDVEVPKKGASKDPKGKKRSADEEESEKPKKKKVKAAAAPEAVETTVAIPSPKATKVQLCLLPKSLPLTTPVDDRSHCPSCSACTIIKKAPTIYRRQSPFIL
ncbi:ribosomal protein L1 [Artomyces pyxidatus]|uniref:Ribosomal protein L1 n=1 Tax=Artomyces pyxidatus TaxID=48021 RepID=A0ACB8SW06_9AGAM|nr:ribosomal protein L1 [Artomyces pyxidatus]